MGLPSYPPQFLTVAALEKRAHRRMIFLLICLGISAASLLFVGLAVLIKSIE